MKKIIGVVVLLTFICSESFAASWKTSWRLQRGDTISGEFKVFQNLYIPLNDLYKSGVLTKEEFEKAKKKILN